jgi:hypothetical protein
MRYRVRPEVTRDNTGHANIDVTQNVGGHRWREERVEAVTRTVAAVFPAGLESPDSGFCLSDCKEWSGREDSNLFDIVSDLLTCSQVIHSKDIQRRVFHRFSTASGEMLSRC